MNRLGTALCVGVALLSLGCSEGATAPDSLTFDPPAAVAPGAGPVTKGLQARLDALAKGIAGAASDPAIRQEIIDAMSASDAPESKIYLRDAVLGASRFADQVAAHFESSGGVRTAMANLPALDFYIATARQRHGWRASGARVAVLAVAHPDQGIGTAFFSDGHQEVVVEPSALAVDALLVIHPTERIDRSDGVEQALAAVRLGSVPVDRPEEDFVGATVECEPGSDDCGGGGSGYTITSVDQFRIRFTDWVGSAEVEFRANGLCGTVGQASGTYRKEGVEPYVTYSGGPLIRGWAPALCPGNGRVQVKLYETDPLGIANYYGENWWEQSQNGLWKQYWWFGDLAAEASVDWIHIP